MACFPVVLFVDRLLQLLFRPLGGAWVFRYWAQVPGGTDDNRSDARVCAVVISFFWCVMMHQSIFARALSFCSRHLVFVRCALR